MKPIKFEQANKNLLKPESMTDEECSSLWVYNDGRECISCWRLCWWHLCLKMSNYPKRIEKQS